MNENIEESNLNSWLHFEKTGKVTDYLAYVEEDFTKNLFSEELTNANKDKWSCDKTKKYCEY